VGLIIVAHGAGQRRSVGQWAPLARRVAPDFSSSRCVGLRVFCRARESLEMMMKEAEEKKTVSLPLLHVQGKEKGEQCRSKRHCSALYFFYMKRRRFMKNASFHLKVAPAFFFQISP
jgi:hypothetical protein